MAKGFSFNGLVQAFTALVTRVDDLYPINSVVLRMDSVNPTTLYPGTWQLITGDASLTFGNGASQPGIPSGNNTQAVPLLNHNHTGPSHTHSGPSHNHQGGAHTHAGPSHVHSGPNHRHVGGSHDHSANHNHGASSASAGNHRHSIEYGVGSDGTGFALRSSGVSDNSTYPSNYAGAHSHTVTVNTKYFNTGSGGSVWSGYNGTGSTGSAGTGQTGSGGYVGTSSAGTGQTGSSGTGATSSTGDSSPTVDVRGAQIAINVWQRTS